MKKYVSIICSMIIVVFIVLSICVPVFASEYDYEEEAVDDYKGADDTWYQNFDYRLEGDNIVLYNYTGNVTDLYIPATAEIEGRMYHTKLNYYAINFHNERIKSIRFSRDIDTSNVVSMSGMFSLCENLSVIDISGFDTSNVVNMSYMFCDCKSLTSIDLSNFNTSNVTDMSGMFSYCPNLQSLDVSSFDTRNVRHMYDMFSVDLGMGIEYSSLQYLDLSSWDLGSLENETDILLDGTTYNINHGKVFSRCTGLRSIKTPRNVPVDIPLPNVFVQQDNRTVEYISLPIGQGNSLPLVKRDDNYIPVTGVTVSPGSKTINVGDDFKIESIITPNNATNQNVIWSSSNTNVAVLSERTYYPYDKIVQGIGEGTAVITCTTADGSLTASCTVAVVGSSPAVTYNCDYAWEVLDIVNRERIANGVQPLVMDKGIWDAAQIRAKELTVRFSHTRPDGTGCSTIFPDYGDHQGENIARGQLTPSDAMISWMNSPGHRSNILNGDFKSIGIGCVYTSGLFGPEYYWVQCFSSELREPILKGCVPAEPVTTDDGTIPMYRAYNPNSGEHFYTYNYNELVNLGEAGWQYEGVAWYAPNEGEPVYRLYNPYSGDHHYTLYTVERDALVNVGWIYEGEAWKSNNSGNGTPVYRLFNPNAQTASHHYTTNVGERDYLILNGWLDEGIGWYGN